MRYDVIDIAIRTHWDCPQCGLTGNDSERKKCLFCGYKR